jgi:uncharacterized membrane protein YebE (DUF533 family)
MFDVERLLGQMLSKGMNQATGGLGESLGSGLGAVTGGIGSSVGKGALGMGALGLAFAAWDHYKEKQADAAPAMPPPLPASAMPPPPPGAYGAAPQAYAPAPMAAPMALPAAAAPIANAALVDESQARERDAQHLISAMIAAANADGQIDAEERSHILERAMSANLSGSTQAFLLAELKQPKSLNEILSATPSALRREVYGASVLALQVDNQAEHDYLLRLAQGLQLSPEHVAEIKTAIGRA